MSVIDKDGYRSGVAIVLVNSSGKLFWGKRIGQLSWQFPQGGILQNEPPLLAMYRELKEETGLLPFHVDVLASTEKWLQYDIPHHLLRQSNPMCIGQRQKWFLLKLMSDETVINLTACTEPEFDDWIWTDIETALADVIEFKRTVYQQALTQFRPLITEQ